MVCVFSDLELHALERQAMFEMMRPSTSTHEITAFGPYSISHSIWSGMRGRGMAFPITCHVFNSIKASSMDIFITSLMINNRPFPITIFQYLHS